RLPIAVPEERQQSIPGGFAPPLLPCFPPRGRIAKTDPQKKPVERCNGDRHDESECRSIPQQLTQAKASLLDLRDEERKTPYQGQMPSQDPDTQGNPGANVLTALGPKHCQRGGEDHDRFRVPRGMKE